jgi:protoheme IX farnesyltransferase
LQQGKNLDAFFGRMELMEKEKTSTGITESGLSVLADYLELTRPGLTIFSVGTALCGCYLAMTENISYHRLLVAFIGTYLTGSSAGVLNQFIERKYDELMARTSRRPLPEGRIKPISALIFGAVLSFTGIFWLIFAANVLSGIIAFMTL